MSTEPLPSEPDAVNTADPLALAVLEQRKTRNEEQRRQDLQHQPAQLGDWQDAPQPEHRRHLGALIALRHADLLGPLNLSEEQRQATEHQAQGVWMDGSVPALLLPRPNGQAIVLTRRRGTLYQVGHAGQTAVKSAADLDLDAGIPEVQPFTRPGFLTQKEKLFKPRLNTPWRPWIDEEGHNGLGLLALGLLVMGGLGSGVTAGLYDLFLTVFRPAVPFSGLSFLVGAAGAATVTLVLILRLTYTQFLRNARVQQERLTPVLLPPQSLSPSADPAPVPEVHTALDPHF